MLKTYDDFIERVNELGFFSFYGKFLDGFPKLQDETIEEQWHTGDIETDPWKWKDRAAMEKKLAFGCVLGGYKGFISKEFYPLFYSAFRPAMDIEEYYESGHLSHTALKLYRLFDNGNILSTFEIRNTLGVTKKTGAGRVDGAIQELERNFYITVCGNKRKISSDGREYGWPAITYCRVEDWVHEDWLDDVPSIDPIDARSLILDRGCFMCKNIDRMALSKLLFKNNKGGII